MAQQRCRAIKMHTSDYNTIAADTNLLTGLRISIVTIAQLHCSRCRATPRALSALYKARLVTVPCCILVLPLCQASRSASAAAARGAAGCGAATVGNASDAGGSSDGAPRLPCGDTCTVSILLLAPWYRARRAPLCHPWRLAGKRHENEKPTLSGPAQNTHCWQHAALVQWRPIMKT